MFRRNPDALALIVIGVFALALSVPRIILREARWDVTPIKVQMEAEREHMRAAQLQIEAQRRAMKATVESIRDSIHR